MFSERLGAEESRCQEDFHGLSVSKRLVRSVSQKLRNKNNNRSLGKEEDEDDNSLLSHKTESKVFILPHWQLLNQQVTEKLLLLCQVTEHELSNN
jgi:hypothetical protein